MGWFYPSFVESRSDLLRELSGDLLGLRCSRRYVCGNVLWILWAPAPDWAGDNWIGCYLMQKVSGQWGYKAMAEAEHPFYYSCPMSFLDAAPVADAEWREGVRQYWEARKAKQAAKRGRCAESALPCSSDYAMKMESRQAAKRAGR